MSWVAWGLTAFAVLYWGGRALLIWLLERRTRTRAGYPEPDPADGPVAAPDPEGQLRPPRANLRA